MLWDSPGLHRSLVFLDVLVPYNRVQPLPVSHIQIRACGFIVICNSFPISHYICGRYMLINDRSHTKWQVLASYLFDFSSHPLKNSRSVHPSPLIRLCTCNWKTSAKCDEPALIGLVLAARRSPISGFRRSIHRISVGALRAWHTSTWKILQLNRHQVSYLLELGRCSVFLVRRSRSASE